MLTDYSLKMPKEVYGGEHALEKLKDVMSVNDVKKVAVFTDHGIRGTGLLELPMQMLTQAGVETVILDDLPAEPTYSQVQVLVDAFRAEKADIIVAVGGGSVIDTAKGIAIGVPLPPFSRPTATACMTCWMSRRSAENLSRPS